MQYRILAGLPGTGPEPYYFGGAHPTPWSEGVVIRFDDPQRGSWVGNFQHGYTEWDCVLHWPEARTIVVTVRGIAYLIDADDPKSYRVVQQMVTSAALTPDRSILVIADHSNLVAYAADRSTLWFRERLALDGIEIEGFEPAVVYGRYCIDPDRPWKPFRIRLMDGRNA